MQCPCDTLSCARGSSLAPGALPGEHVISQPGIHWGIEQAVAPSRLSSHVGILPARDQHTVSTAVVIAVHLSSMQLGAVSSAMAFAQLMRARQLPQLKALQDSTEQVDVYDAAVCATSKE